MRSRGHAHNQGSRRRRRTRALHRSREGHCAYRTISAFDSAHLRAKERDLGRDRPARVHESVGPMRHRIEPKGDLKERAKREFLAEVEGELDAMAVAASSMRSSSWRLRDR